MPRVRTLVASGLTALALIVATAGPAWAPWKGLSDLHFDDGGRFCHDGFEFSLTHLLPVTASITANVAGDPTAVVVPTTPLTQLRFGPVPELFNLGDYYYASTFRVAFAKRQPTGTELDIQFSGGATGLAGSPAIANCRLGKPSVGFVGLQEPPSVNPIASDDPIAVTFGVPGRGGSLDIFTEGPFFAPIPCAPTGENPTFLQSIASGMLSYDRRAKTYTYLWDTPTGLTGCNELWFRLGTEGLQRRVLFDFGT